MKRLPFVIVMVIAVLVAVVTGCGGTPSYDGRLTAADSLMRTNPDSALALLEAIPMAGLATAGDSAYRDLLLTQARYRCYVTATSDSAINRALAYYRAHDDEREKLTRAYIYKGAVMDELGHPDSAMFYYKQAEATAAPDDYFNLAQINTRIASLYRIYYADFQTCFEKYSIALKYYELIGDKKMQQQSIYNMGVCAGITHNADAVELLEKSLGIAVELKDSFNQYQCKELLCRQLSIDTSHFKESKLIALDCLINYKKYVNEDLLLDIAHLYAMEDKIDSAWLYIKLVDNSLCSDSDHVRQIEYRKNVIMSNIAENVGDMSLYKNTAASAVQVSEQVHNGKTKHIIQSIENQHKQDLILKNEQKNLSLKVTIWLSLTVFLFALVFLIGHFLKKLNRTKALMNEIRENGVNAHDDFIMQISGKNSEISHFVTSMVELIRTAMEAKSILQMLSFDNKVKSLVSQTTTDDFWLELLDHLDKANNGFISRISENPLIKKKDLRFIGLLCYGFTYTEIAFIMDYSPKYISNKRKNIARKLEIDVPLLTFIEQELAKCQDINHYQKQ
ncbi:MAG: hypothetical protein IKW85_07750 [Muribaculaceae bacterium]|nr:hypothetical protein [Muribaculaceae bacterium]